MKDGRNLTLVMDFYELTMSQCYYKEHREEEAIFDLFYRKNPDDGGFCIAAGLEQAIEYIRDFHVSKGDIEYLRSLHLFEEDFLEYLSTVRFTGDLWAVPEGTPIFPNEPVLRVKAKLIEAQLVETALLLAINYQTLIATKARRIVQAAEGRAVMEFGARRAHSFDAAIYGARAAYIVGCAGTATTFAGEQFQIPVLGTMAHSFVQSFDTEYEAFLNYAKTYPEHCTLLIDTYSTLGSGIENAIKVAKDYLEPNGYRLQGVRIDSGDMAYLSKRVRKKLDEANMNDCKIVVSNSLDEYVIESLIHQQGAKIDSFGVGENLICSRTSPVFGGVYKMVAIKEGEEWVPKIKISDNLEKVTNPGWKDLYRIYDRESQKAVADLMCLHQETIDPNQDLTIYHPMSKWKYKVFPAGSYEFKDLLIKVFEDGKQIYTSPSITQIRAYCLDQQETLWDELKRFAYPQEYYVDLSGSLFDLKQDLLEAHLKKRKARQAFLEASIE
ncbi:nicotinate phosphoribosyltransferase [Dubosiella newyorkensis]|uniref:nicotinate phosphoribosyltransferase n=1 Tax=Dubosiella newyorkensis TaxID=1862672 RepID=UPI0023F0A81F|nr:nicotinate phosphoribosyltransferase [Dubosiella newyorkensis]